MLASDMLAVTAALALALWAFSRHSPDSVLDADPGSVDTLPTEDDQQTPTMLQSLAASLDSRAGAFAPAPTAEGGANLAAFLDMIAYSEGTSGPDGYRTMFGGRLFDSYADHPRQVISFVNSKGQALRTSAAGRYQFLARTWDDLRAKLGLSDFTPDSQDAACAELIRQRGALADVLAGRTAAAIVKCAPTWASLPGAGYAQPERKLSQLLAAYASAGGNITEA